MVKEPDDVASSCWKLEYLSFGMEYNNVNKLTGDYYHVIIYTTRKGDYCLICVKKLEW